MYSNYAQSFTVLPREEILVLLFLYTLIIVAFIDTFSQFPIISSFAQSLGANSLYIGLIVGMYSLSNIFGNVISGFFIDKYGRKWILAFSMLYISICVLFYTLVTSPLQLLTVRFLHGIGGGLLIPTIFALLGDLLKIKNHGKAMAFSGACIGLTAIIGPAFGSMTAQFVGVHWVFYVVSLLFLTFGLCIFPFIKEESLPYEKRVVSFNYKELRKLLSSKRLNNAYLSVFILTFTLGTLVYLLPLKVEEIGLPFTYSGMLLSTFGLTAIFVFLLPINKIFDGLYREKIISYGMFLISLSLLGLSIFLNIFLLFICLMFYGLGFAFMFPSINALILDHCDKRNRGKGFGLFYAFFSLGVVVGSFIIGLLNVRIDHAFLFSSMIMFIFLLILIKRSYPNIKS